MQQPVAAKRPSDKSLRRVYGRIFCENLCLGNRILSPQHVRAQIKNQIRQNLCDLSRRQNPVAEKKIFSQKFSRTHEAICRCDVSPQRVASTSRPTCTHGVICRRDVLLQLAA